jgi:cold shock CspA family protein
MYQVKWFSKKKGYGFVEDSAGKEFFVHHTDIQVSDGFRYLREGEYVVGSEEAMDGDKVKVAQIRAPMEGGKLMCEVERRTRRTRQEASGDETTTEA